MINRMALAHWLRYFKETRIFFFLMMQKKKITGHDTKEYIFETRNCLRINKQGDNDQFFFFKDKMKTNYLKTSKNQIVPEIVIFELIDLFIFLKIWMRNGQTWRHISQMVFPFSSHHRCMQSLCANWSNETSFHTDKIVLQ